MYYPIMRQPLDKFPRSLDPEYNQLNFNLNNAWSAHVENIRFHKPGPIVIEKLLGDEMKESEKYQTEMPLKMSVVSEENLSLAIRLAKRDLMQKKFETDYPQESKVSLSPAKENKKSKKVSKRERTLQSNKDVKARYNKSKPKQDVLTLVSAKSSSKADLTSSGHVLLERKHSEFTKEHYQKCRRQPSAVTSTRRCNEQLKESPDSKQAQEIKRLRHELSYYVQKIEKLSRNGPSPIKDTHSKNSLEVDEPDEHRKQVRAAEQASRSARLLYALQQQVREIQDDLDRIGPNQIRHTRKSRTLNRLAAAHRGAIRALQTFIQHLPGQVNTTSGGLPPAYQELAILIRQLSLCCTQMEIGETVPDGILNILQQAKDFQNDVEVRKPKVQPRSTSQRQLHFKENEKPKATKYGNNSTRKLTTHSASSPVIEQELLARDISIPTMTSERTRDDNKPERDTVDMLHKELQRNDAIPMTPERHFALRASLDALLRAASDKQVPTNRPKRAIPKPRSSKQSMVAGARKTGVLLPKSNRIKKKGVQNRNQPIQDVGFTHATIASNLKTREVAKPEITVLPPWSPFGVPKVTGKVGEDTFKPGKDYRVVSPQHSPRHSPKTSPRSAVRKVHFEEDEITWGRLNPKMMEKEVARQAWLDKESDKKMTEMQSLVSSTEMERLTAQVIQEAEEAIRRKLEPVVQVQPQQKTAHVGRSNNDSHQTKPSASIPQSILKPPGVLSMTRILEDDFHSFEDDMLMEEKAQDMQEEPMLEKFIQRLEEMETEEDIIRHRLQKITYADSSDGSTLPNAEHEEGVLILKGTPLDGAELERMSSDVVVQHTSIQFTNKLHGHHKMAPQERYRLPQLHTPVEQESEPDGDAVWQTGAEVSSLKIQGILSDEDEKSTRLHELEFRDVDTTNHMHIVGPIRLEERTSKQTHSAPVNSWKKRSLTLDKPRTTLFISSQNKKRIEDCRGRFDQHLKLMCHHTYGSFNPWKIVEDVADEILDELLVGVADEIGDMTGMFIDNLCKREFGNVNDDS